jgi:hypothetical protein
VRADYEKNFRDILGQPLTRRLSNLAALEDDFRGALIEQLVGHAAAEREGIGGRGGGCGFQADAAESHRSTKKMSGINNSSDEYNMGLDKQ